MESDGSMTSQMGGLCRTLNFQLRNIAHIRKYLDQDTCHHIVRSFVLSRFDYGISLLAGSTNAQLNKLQRNIKRFICQNQKVDLRLTVSCSRTEHFIRIDLVDPTSVSDDRHKVAPSRKLMTPKWIINM